METLWRDLKYGARMLVKSPGFTAVAAIALALGIGANTAIFSVVNAVLIRSLPFRDPDRLVMVWENNRVRGNNRNVISAANYLDWQDQNSVLEQMAAFYDYRGNLTGMAEPEELPIQNVTANFFDLIGVNSAIGRTFTSEEGQRGRNHVIILSNGLWKRRFGGDPGLIGKTIRLSEVDFTVIGVMPPGFDFFVKQGSLTGKHPEAWVPIAFSPNARVRQGRFMSAVAKLKPGVTLAQAQAEMDRIAGNLEEQYKDFNAGWGVNLVPLKTQLVGTIRPALLVLLGAVAFVLLIACANVANLLLARAASREKEIAIRAALGARRSRVIRQLLTEATLLAALGGGLGLLLAMWGVELLLALTPKEIGLTGAGLDYRVLGFTLAASLLTGLMFGLAPALQASRTNLNQSLKEGGRGASSGGRSHRLRGVFVVAEVALALVLLIGSGLMIRSFARLESVDPGFDAKNVLTIRLLLPANKYGQDPQVLGFFRQLVERVQSMPGVLSAGAVSFLPFAGPYAGTLVEIQGRPQPPPGEGLVTGVCVTDGNYFRTMQIPLKRGRLFTDQETSEMRHVVVINEAFARKHFPGEDPLGRRVTIYMKDANEPSEIIGIVGDSKHMSLDGEVEPMSYWPHPELVYSGMTLVVRTQSDPTSIAEPVRSLVLSMDKDQPVADVRTMEELLSESLSRARFSTLLLGIFAGVALLLAAVGIFGIMSYAVSERTHEIGLRMALGAQTRDVVGLVVRQGMLLSLTGIGIGLVTAFALTRLLATLLYEVSTTDPATFVVLSITLAAVAFVACYLPARRATKVDPMVALRYE
ncbi:MAG TPA: ABC transporter permease [Blastocatellia bacterium]|nr:ABC transporter permease [Blastocatellia bacterium]